MKDSEGNKLPDSAYIRRMAKLAMEKGGIAVWHEKLKKAVIIFPDGRKVTIAKTF